MFVIQFTKTALEISLLDNQCSIEKHCLSNYDIWTTDKTGGPVK